ncbi:MAG TPA: ABC transporter ATP-binding protein [Clostridiaceae bacterium]|nr:ABC transporter ATP-binding protein [Clostridiaceae bacterium]
MTDSTPRYAVEMNGIFKSFAKVKALEDVDLKVRPGTIHALLGENGAGKSTLMKILYGLYNADKGEILINGKSVQIRNPRAAIDLGIGMVHQHFMLVDNFTIAENIVLGHEVTRGFGVLNQDLANKNIAELGHKYGLDVDPKALIQDVSVATQQRVEILKALYRGIDILILDEPTAVLTPQEITSLIDTMHRLVEDGKTIIIITHKLKEIKAVAEYCTVIRRGKLIDTVLVDEVSQSDLANMMVGREVKLTTDKGERSIGDLVLSVSNLHVRDRRGVLKVHDLSLHLREGEILAIAGVDGNGQTELIDAITGLAQAESGQILMRGTDITNKQPRDVHEAGIRTIHEDRQKRGLVLDFTVAEDLVLETYDQAPYSRRGVLKWPVIHEHAADQIKRFDIRPKESARQKVRDLSGGNQQKVIVAREIHQNPSLLIACQPTRGLDVGAIEFVRKALVEQSTEGKAILLVSLELDEVFDLADRINVIYNGKIVADLNPAETNEQQVGLLMAGGEL